MDIFAYCILQINANTSGASPNRASGAAEAVAFTARYTGDWFTFQPGDRIIFNQEVFNTGPYDTSTGVFTCPVAGKVFANYYSLFKQFLIPEISSYFRPLHHVNLYLLT